MKKYNDLMDTKEKILFAATEEFANKGFHATTTRDICKKVKMNTAAANYHFNTKLELYSQVFKYLFSEFTTKAGKTNHLQEPDYTVNQVELLIKEWILDFLLALLDSTPTSRWRSLLIAREMTTPSEIFPWLFENYFKPIITELQDYLKYIFPNKNNDQVLFEVFSILSQCLFYVQDRSIAESTFGKDFYSKQKLSEVADHIYEGLMIKAKYSANI